MIYIYIYTGRATSLCKHTYHHIQIESHTGQPAILILPAMVLGLYLPDTIKWAEQKYDTAAKIINNDK